MLIAKPSAGAAKATDDFVYHQQYIVFLADFLNSLPIALWWHNHAATGCNWLKDQTAYGISAFT